MIPFSLPGFPGFFHEMEVKKMMKERKKLVFRAMACLTVMAVVLLIGANVIKPAIIIVIIVRSRRK